MGTLKGPILSLATTSADRPYDPCASSNNNPAQSTYIGDETNLGLFDGFGQVIAQKQQSRKV